MAVLKVTQKAQIADDTKQHIFLAKYIDILLVKDDVKRIVTGGNFHGGLGMLDTDRGNRSAGQI